MAADVGFADSDLDLCHDALGYALRRAQVRSYDLLFAMLGPQALSPARMTTLSRIAMHPGIRASALAVQLGIQRASLVKVLDALADQDLIRRDPVDGDRRAYALHVTETGKTHLRQLRRRMEEFELALAARLTRQERYELIQLLEKLAVPDDIQSDPAALTTPARDLV